MFNVFKQLLPSWRSSSGTKNQDSFKLEFLSAFFYFFISSFFDQEDEVTMTLERDVY